MSLIQEIGHGLAHLIYPQLCEGCRTPLLKQEEVLCLGCLGALPRTGFHADPDNEAAIRLAGRIPYQRVTSFCYFTVDGLLQHLLHRLKYEGRPHIGVFLGRQLGYELKQEAWARSLELIIPVPLHPRKEAIRGFNQSERLAAGLAEVLGIPVGMDVLQRARPTESQTRKSRVERVANVKDAFRLKPGSWPGAQQVLLLDDVLTTGATLEAAARAILEEQPVSLSLATIGLASD